MIMRTAETVPIVLNSNLRKLQMNPPKKNISGLKRDSNQWHKAASTALPTIRTCTLCQANMLKLLYFASVGRS